MTSLIRFHGIALLAIVIFGFAAVMEHAATGSATGWDLGMLGFLAMLVALVERAWRLQAERFGRAVP